MSDLEPPDRQVRIIRVAFLRQLSYPGPAHSFLNKSSGGGRLAGSIARHVWMNLTNHCTQYEPPWISLQLCNLVSSSSTHAIALCTMCLESDFVDEESLRSSHEGPATSSSRHKCVP
ncbi:hypothetical protein M413DRAFT_437752 [Hebeloma cylindrosporum]|uniref:Uncharacterized protein n=1 Tax=Hebeloma cylindrosporum TaxID=76867 RepID=A0A0C2YFM1_HEBCY|nr:hypothetical protein M413DRAFT_437752 [Hebeloma cylindrosporum h7]